MSTAAAIFNVEAAGQVYNNQTNEFVYLGGNINHNADPTRPSRSTGAYGKRMVQLPDYIFEL